MSNLTLFLLFAISTTQIFGFSHNLREFSNPLKLFNKCISDHECKNQEYCDHTGINPIGTCKLGNSNGHSCVFDRHCQSKYLDRIFLE